MTFEQAHVFVTATGGTGAVGVGHLARMRHNAVVGNVGNVGHFDTEIDLAGLAAVPGVTKTEIKPQVHLWTFPDGHAVLVLSEGRLFDLGNATGHPSFVMSASFANQVLAQIELFTNPELSREQAACLGVDGGRGALQGRSLPVLRSRDEPPHWRPATVGDSGPYLAPCAFASIRH